jgi:NAD(P)H-hydrate epimerase
VITSGGPELATIGTGDVLSGVVAALWAQGLDTEIAARSGAFWHGVAGSRLAALRTVTAEELVYAVGELS